jgi:hypothetical protein
MAPQGGNQSALGGKAELALCDFQYFITEFLDLKLWAWQKKLCDDVQAFIDGDVYFNAQFLAPADHGKTSRVVIPLVLWLLARDRRNRIILLGNKDSYIEQVSRACKTRIDMSPKLEAFGLRRGIKWADDEWHIERPNITDKDPSVLAIGVGGEIQSQRSEYVIGDDVFTRRNSRTESQRAALNSFVQTDVGSRLDKTHRSFGKAKMMLFGHRVEANDGYKMREGYVSGPDAWMCKKYPAIVDDSKQEILCPEAHTYEELTAHRSRDILGFSLMYQQQSAQMGTFITQTTMESVRKNHLKFHNSRQSINMDEYLFTWMSLDPAFSQKRWSSHAVWELWGMTKDYKRRLLWALRDKVSPESLLNISEFKFRLFLPDHFLCEANQAQVLILPYLKKKFPDHQSKFKPVHTHDNDGQLQEDIQKVFNLYSSDPPQVEIPFGGPSEQAFAIAMTDEFTSYPNGSRDIVMSQYIGEKGLGLIKDEERKGHVHNKGVMGSVSSRYSRQAITRPMWRKY